MLPAPSAPAHDIYAKKTYIHDKTHKAGKTYAKLFVY